MRGLRATWLLAGLFLFALSAGAVAEVAQKGKLRVAFEGQLSPTALPRSKPIPVSVSMGGKISTTGGPAPQLQKITIAINRYGLISPGALPSCAIEEIQPSTTEGALEACEDSLVGEGSFAANVLLPEQTPFPSKGKVYAFNGTYEGKRAILAHVYGTQPAPTSYTLPFVIKETKGTFGTTLSASLPQVTSKWGYVTALSLKLNGTGGFLRASCPAPAGFGAAVFPLAKTTFAFAGGKALGATLNRRCSVRG